MENKLTTLFVGVDIHKNSHTMVGVNALYEPLGRLTFANTLAGYRQATDFTSRLARKHNLRPLFGLEDTGGHGLPFARYLLGEQIPIKGINPLLVKRKRQYETHPEKSDPQDALGVAKVLVERTDALPLFTLTQTREFAKDMAYLSNDRDRLIIELTSIKNRLHRVLFRLWGLAYRTVVQKDIFGKKALLFWEKYPAAIDFKKTRRPIRHKPEWLTRTPSSELPIATDYARTYVRRLISRYRFIQREIKTIEADMEVLLNHSGYHYLTTLPGCNTVTALALLSHIGDIKCFPTASKLARYAGIAPRKFESGERKRDVISRHGHSRLRRCFKTIALSQLGINGRQESKAYYRRKLREGKTKQQAIRCLMRVNVNIVFAMLNYERPYYL